MKYAIQLSYHMCDLEKDEEYDKWVYVGVMNDEHRTFVMNDKVVNRTKLFDTVAEAGVYLYKHFPNDLEKRCSYSSARIVEV